MKTFRKLLALVLVLTMVFSCTGSAFAVQKRTVINKNGANVKLTMLDQAPEAAKKLAEKNRKNLNVSKTPSIADDAVVTAVVEMEGKALIDSTETRSAAHLQKLAKQHTALMSVMDKAEIDYTLCYDYGTLLNGFAISTTYGNLEKIAKLDGVVSVHVANRYSAPKMESAKRTANANSMIGVDLFHAANLNGENTIIAVIDTGLNTAHEAFRDYGITGSKGLTKAAVAAASLNATAGAYVSAKIPFVCDYVGDSIDNPKQDSDVSDTLGFGTHVSGIACGYAKTNGKVTFEGVAPAAQLLAMKIYDINGETDLAALFAAVEDAYTLGADIINISLGEPHGFAYDTTLESTLFGDIYQKMADNGVIVAAAQGDDGYLGAHSNNWAGQGTVLGANPDYGTGNSPASYGSNVAVASIENVSYPDGNGGTVKNENAWLVSDFSSMGTTSELTFKPTISSIGGYVNSASAYSNDGYLVSSSTGMATPAASGSFALLSEYAEKEFTKDCYAKNFTDVKLNQWYHEAVDFVVSQGLVAGTSATTFSPNSNLTRAQMVAILYRQAGNPNVDGLTIPFTDVSKKQYYYSAVLWAYNNNIVAGLSATTFAPNTNVTREQLVTILYRYAGAPTVAENYLAGYTDLKSISSYAVPAVNWAVSKQILTSLSTTTQIIGPRSTATRAQFARIMMVYLDKAYKCGQAFSSKLERAEFVKALAESTAAVLADNLYQLYSPRKQGAGLMNVAYAASAPAYIPEPLIELGDDPERVGIYEFSFEVTSLSDKTTYYQIDPWVIIDAAGEADGKYYNLCQSEFAIAEFVTNWGAKDSESDETQPDGVPIVMPEDILVLEPGKTETVEVMIALNDETIEYMEAAYENGGFVDGYVFLWESTVDENGNLHTSYEDYIHASFLGFYGDWTDAPILEQYDFADVIAANSYLNNVDVAEEYPQYAGSSYADLGFTYYDLYNMDTDANLAYIYETQDGQLDTSWDMLGGSIYFWNDQNDAYNCISNADNEDGTYACDTVVIMPMQLRNARHLIMTVTDSSTGKLYAVDDEEYSVKASYSVDAEAFYPSNYFVWDGINYMDGDGSYLPNGTQVDINFYANLPYGEDGLGDISYENLLTQGEEYLEWSFPVTIDNQSPEFATEATLIDGLLTFSAMDNGYMSSILAYDENGVILDAILSEAEPGEMTEYTLDVNGFEGILYIEAGDYATNYAIGYIELGGEKDGVYDWVSEVDGDMSGEYLLTGMNSALFMLNASGDVTGTSLATSAGALSWNDVEIDADYETWETIYTDDERVVWVFERTSDGSYTIRMKNSNNYLACNSSGTLTTVTSASNNNAKWNLAINDVPDGEGDYYALCDLRNVGTKKALLFDSEAGVFNCFNASYTLDGIYNLDLYRAN